MLHIFKYSKEKIEKPIFIYGVGGGMGNVAKLVGKKLIKTYKAKKYCVILSDAYPDVVYANRHGILDILKLTLYHFKHNNQDFLVLYGDLQPNVQPFDISERYKVAILLLRMLKNFNTKIIISIGGYGLEIEPENPKLYFSSNNKKTLKKIKEKLPEDFNLYKNSNIVGLSGLIVTLAKYYRIPAYIVLAETYPTATINGYLGAKKVLEMLSKLYDFEYDLKDYEEKGKKIREDILRKMTKIEKKPIEKKKSIYYFG